MLPAEQVPASNAKGPSFINYEQDARLWRQLTNLGPGKRASALILRRDSVARQVCLGAESDAVTNIDGLGLILAILRKYFEPDPVDLIYQEVLRFMQFKRKVPTMEAYATEFELLCRKSGIQETNGRRLPRRICIDPAHAGRGAVEAGEITGIGQFAGRIGFSGCSETHETSVRITWRISAAGCSGGRGGGRVISQR